MVRIAAERISDLFALAEKEAGGDFPELADRYVRLARRIGMRYNVRLPPQYSELYCRGCSRFWVEGRTVRTRLRSGRRVRTCLACGRERRVPYRPGVRPGPAANMGPREVPLPTEDAESGPRPPRDAVGAGGREPKGR
jgi:ribonuclease P protein subunit RPR2